MKKEYKPRSVKVLRGGDKAWLYVNEKSIDVFIGIDGKDAVSCRLTKRQLESILNNDHD